MPRHHEAKKSDREDCKDHDCDDLPHDAKPHALKPRPLTRHTGERNVFSTEPKPAMKMNAGGVNACADRYAKYLGRRVHENTARVALRSAMAAIRAG